MFELSLLTVVLWIICLGVAILSVPFVMIFGIALVALAMAAVVGTFAGALWLCGTVISVITRVTWTVAHWFKRTAGVK